MEAPRFNIDSKTIRRTCLAVAATGLALALACSRPSNPNQQPNLPPAIQTLQADIKSGRFATATVLDAVDTRNWPEIHVPSDSNKVTAIPNIEEIQAPNIGLRALYLTSHSSLPIVLVTPYWDQERAVRVNLSLIEQQRGIWLKFIVEDNLIPNLRQNIVTSAPPSALVQPETIARFWEDSKSMIASRAVADGVDKGPTHTVTLWKTSEDSNVSIIFGEDLVSKSPLSYLKTKIRFLGQDIRQFRSS